MCNTLWTESIAIGSKGFVEKIKLELGVKTIGREVMGGDRVYEVREGSSYSGHFAGKNSGLSRKNTYFWNLSV